MSRKVIKVKYKDTMTRLEVATRSCRGLSADISFHDLKSQIFELFKLKGDASDLNLRYTDVDGDVITILNDNGLSDALRQNICPFYMEASFSVSEGSCPKSTEIFFNNLGPFGGGGGIEWNDGNFEGVNGITVTASSESLLSIQFSYAAAKGKTHIGAQHGGRGEEIHSVKFKYPSEKLQKISGCCGVVESTLTVIKGLSFETNVAKYGPFGVADWVPFECDLRSRDVVGFYGRACNRYLGSIGLHTLNATKTQHEKGSEIII